MTYIVFRHGSNAANQSRTPVAIVGTVEGNRSTAMAAARGKFTLYNNQHFELRPASKCSEAQKREAWEEDCALEAAYTDSIVFPNCGSGMPAGYDSWKLDNGRA